MSGPVPADLVFADWIERQPAELQEMALGTIRGRLVHTGGLTFRQLYNESGRYYLTTELRTLYPIAFAISGLR